VTAVLEHTRHIYPALKQQLMLFGQDLKFVAHRG
jgi:hypothetical protein